MFNPNDPNGENYDPAKIIGMIFGQIPGIINQAQEAFGSGEDFATKIPGMINITDALGDSARVFGPNVAQRSSHGYLGKTIDKDGGTAYLFNLAGFKKSEINVSLSEAARELNVVASKGETKNPLFSVISEKVKVEEGTKPTDISTSYVDGLLTVTVKLRDLFGDSDATVINLD